MASKPTLAAEVDRVDYYQRLGKTIGQHLASLGAAMRSSNDPRKVRYRLVRFNMQYRPGLVPTRSTGAYKADNGAGLEMKRLKMAKSAAEKALEDALTTSEATREQFRLARRIVEEQMDRQTSVMSKLCGADCD